MTHKNKFEIKFLSTQSPNYVINELINMIYSEWKSEYNSIDELKKELFLAQNSKSITKILYIEEIKTKNIIGTASLLEEDIKMFSNLSPWLANVYVKNQYRKEGIGSKMIDYIINHAFKIGKEKIYLFTNTKTHWYLKKNWKIIKHFEHNGDQHHLMEFNIDKNQVSCVKVGARNKPICIGE